MEADTNNAEEAVEHRDTESNTNSRPFFFLNGKTQQNRKAFTALQQIHKGDKKSLCKVTNVCLRGHIQTHKQLEGWGGCKKHGPAKTNEEYPATS